MEEGKTLLRFYSTNKHTCSEEFLDGVPNCELLKLCAMLDMVKNSILRGIDEKYAKEIEDDE